jgi:trans-2,3-dihydro-3-hydroxyanthranilate isomerase
MGVYRYTICDVFTDQPLTGNQLAVFPDARAIPETSLQSLAREINFSETVFAYPPTQGGHARIRIFTPGHELPFAGHPVLGSAFVIGNTTNAEEVRLETGRGVVPVRLERDGSRVTFGWMSQPLPTVEPFGDPAALFGALGVKHSVLPVEIYDNRVRHLYVALESDEAVALLRPDLGTLAQIVASCGVNCFFSSGRRVKNRMFAPGMGVAEDAATGSAAGPLTLHLIRHGRIQFGDRIEISQGMEIRRPSTLYSRVYGRDDHVERIEVGGAAVIIGSGEFSLE